MTELKRDFTKVVRDGAKALYNKGSECEICGVEEPLEFHHTKTLSILVNKWVKNNKLNITTLEEAIEQREGFISEHMEEVYESTITLCKQHHMALHKIYGKSPAIGTSPKQHRWVKKQKDKLDGLD